MRYCPYFSSVLLCFGLPSTFLGQHIFETTHPYENNLDLYTEISIPFAIGYIVTFDNSSSVVAGESDSLTIFRDSSHSTFWGSPFMAGNSATEFWGGNDYQLFITGESFIVNFKSDSSNVDWGVRMYVEAVKNDSSVPVQTQLIIESSHQYNPSLEYTVPVAIPNAIAYTVRFDAQSSIDISGNDRLILYSDNSLNYTLGNPVYGGQGDGNNNFQTTDTEYKLLINQTSFVIYFTTDVSGSDYGFKTYITPIFDAKDIPKQTQVLYETPHDYPNSVDSTSVVAVPGAIGYTISFDERCNTHNLLDGITLYRDTTRSTLWGNGFYSGSPSAGNWNGNNQTVSVFINQAFFLLRFTSSTVLTYWGVKLLITPLYTTSECPIKSSWIWETTHTYLPNAAYTVYMVVSNASYLSVSFDPQSELEETADYVAFYKNSLQLDGWGDVRYSADIGSASSFTVKGNTLSIYFHSSPTFNDGWGVKIYVSALAPADVDLTCPPYMTIRSGANGEKQCISVPGAATAALGTGLVHRYSFDNVTANGYGDSVGGDVCTNWYAYAENGELVMDADTASWCALSSTTLSSAGDYFSLELWVSVGATGCDEFETATIIQLGDIILSSANSLSVICLLNNITLSVTNSAGSATWLITKFPFDNTINTHIVLTIEPTSGDDSDGTMYINGKYAGVQSFPSMPSFSAGGRLGFGWHGGGMAPGVVDELRVWIGFPLSASYIASSYASGPDIIPAVACTTGFYSSDYDVAQCTACPEGATSEDAAATCYCDAGRYSNGRTGAALNCTRCPIGYYSIINSTSCTVCPPGSQSLNDRTGCVCDKGYQQLGIDVNISCTLCGNFTYAPTTGSTECRPCPSGTSDGGKGASSCPNCASGTYEVSHHCVDCPINTYAPYSGSTYCPWCPPGTEGNGEGAWYCPSCAIGEYSDNFVCKPCPPGRTTSATGAASINQCLNLTWNYAGGMFLLFLSLLLIYFYILNGRMHLFAMYRKLRVTTTFAYACKELCTVLHLLTARAKEETSIHAANTLKSIVFMVLALCLLFIATLVDFAFTICGIFFMAMIIARALKRAAIIRNIGFIDVLKLWAGSFSLIIPLPSSAFKAVFLPFIYFISALYHFNLNMQTVDLTCEGASAPGKLMLDLIILFFAVISIEANYQLLLALLNLTSKQYFKWSLLSPSKSGSCFVSFCVWVFCTLNPLQGVLQYLMTFVSITGFFAYYGRHRSSTECDTVNGMEGIDSFMAYASTLCVYYLISPILYTMARILHPGTGEQDFLAHSQHHPHAAAEHDNHPFRGGSNYSKDESHTRSASEALEEISPEETWSQKVDAKYRFLASFLSFDIQLIRVLQRIVEHECKIAIAENNSSYPEDLIVKSDVERVITPVASFTINNIHNIPPYGEFVTLVEEEYAATGYSWMARKLLACSILGQLCTAVGCTLWREVALKYARFVLLSFGVWEASSVYDFDLLRQLRNLLETNLYKEFFLDGVAAMATGRAVLLQMIPELTVLSTYTISTASSPLFYSSFVEQVPLYHSYSTLTEYWRRQEPNDTVRQCYILYSLCTEHWVAKYTFNVTRFVLALGIVVFPASVWENPGIFGFFMFLLLFFAFARSCGMLVGMAKSWGVLGRIDAAQANSTGRGAAGGAGAGAGAGDVTADTAPLMMHDSAAHTL